MTEVSENITKEEKRDSKRTTVKKSNNVTELTSNTLIKVKNNITGKLIFVNNRNGNTFVWERQGEDKYLTLGELLEIRNQSINFFKNQLIVVEGVSDGEKANASIEEIYRYLGVEHYYRDFLDLTDYRSICEWSVAEIPSRVKALSAKVKENLIIAINNYIKNGALDSRRKIRAFEEALNCNFDED